MVDHRARARETRARFGKEKLGMRRSTLALAIGTSLLGGATLVACAGGDGADGGARDAGVDAALRGDSDAGPVPGADGAATDAGADDASTDAGPANLEGTSGVLFEPDPATNADDMDSYPHAIRLRHSGAASGTILATFERQMRAGTAPGPGWLFYQSTDGGEHFARLGAPLAPAHFANATNALQPNLLELAHDAGGYPAGTLLFAGETGDGTRLEMQVFRSTDRGATWSFVSVIDSGDSSVSPERPWEPFLLQLDDGRLVAYWSDEITPGGRQNIAGRISTDGGATWGAKFSAWESADAGDRPGMATVARMGDGRYVMSVEMCGAPGDFCRAHYKTSTDGLAWGSGAADMGIRPLPPTGHPLHGAPFVAWTPAGGPQGTLVLNGRDLMHSVGEPNTQAGGHGQTFLVNYDGGAGTWYEATAPVPWVGGSTNTQAGYRSALLPSEDGSSLLYFTTTYTGAGVRNRIVYGTANAAVLPYASRFERGTDVGWQRFGGDWSVADGVYTDRAGGAGDKAVAGSTGWTDYTVEGDVRLDGRGNAGLLLRVSDPSQGVDAHNGYFAGVGTDAGTAFLGRERYDWTALASQPLPGGVATGVWYHLAVQATGCTLALTAQPADHSAPPVTVTATDDGCALTAGQIGVRAFQTPAAWRGISVVAR